MEAEKLTESTKRLSGIWTAKNRGDAVWVAGRTHLRLPKDGRQQKFFSADWSQIQKIAPPLDMVPGLVKGGSLSSDPQERLCSGEPADHPAAVLKENLTAVGPVDLRDSLGEAGDLMGLENPPV